MARSAVYPELGQEVNRSELRNGRYAIFAYLPFFYD